VEYEQGAIEMARFLLADGPLTVGIKNVLDLYACEQNGLN